jgi:hypothetical protein
MMGEDEHPPDRDVQPPPVRGGVDDPAGRDVKEPSLQQQRVLDTYFETPNAAAVARDLDISERQVRRIIEKFRPLLEERRDRDKREIAERSAARRAKLAAWADIAQRENFEALDVLVRSPEAAIRLRAIKMRQDMIDRVMPPTAPMSELELVLMEKEREVAEAIRRAQLAEMLSDEPQGADDE